MKRFLFIIPFALFLTGCSEPEKIDFLSGSLSGNSDFFSYSRVNDELASIYITDARGRTIREIRDSNNHSFQGAFLNEAFYYVLHSDEAQDSKVMKCDLKEFTCHEIYYSSGSIKCLFNYRNRLHFFQSRYVKETHGDSGYSRYKIKSITFDGNEETIHFGRNFTYLRCPIVVNHEVYVSLSLPMETFQIEGKKVISRDDYTLIVEKGTYGLKRTPLKINRSMFLLQYISKEISYLAINYDGRYKYGLCKNINTCEIATSTTNPVFINGKFYYGIWDREKEKIKILKWQ